MISPVIFPVLSKVGVIIATTGRREVVTQTIDSILHRASLPACIVVVGAQKSDLPESDWSQSATRIILTLAPQKGSALQRNYGLALLPSTIEFVSFLDDDVELHDQYFYEVNNVFEQSPTLVAFSGMVLTNGNIETNKARKQLDEHNIPEGMPFFGHFPNKWPGLYGCSMNMRREIIELVKFDDNLPLYAIGEDTEVGFRLSQHGEVGGSARCPLVHLATRSGRIAEVGVGYAQIVNFIYFAHKEIGYPRFFCYFERLIKVPLANLIFSVFPRLDTHTFVDRKGRLRGNLLAFRDLIQGKAHPSRLLQIVKANL
jgi:hypothetical protein